MHARHPLLASLTDRNLPTALPFHVRIEPSGRIIGTAEGHLVYEEIVEALRGQWSATDMAGRFVLWDLRRIEVDLEGEEIRRLADFVLKSQGDKRPARVALVAPDDLTFGLLRMYESHRDQTHTEVRVFREYDAADTWTTDPPPQPGDRPRDRSGAGADDES